MKRNEIIAIIFFILASIGTVLIILGAEHYRRTTYYTVELTARAPDNGNWYPRQIKIPYGEDVKILIRNIETVTHGFALPDFNISIPEIKAGEVQSVQFKANKKGNFLFMCTVWCSMRHMEMSGELVVE